MRHSIWAKKTNSLMLLYLTGQFRALWVTVFGMCLRVEWERIADKNVVSILKSLISLPTRAIMA